MEPNARLLPECPPQPGAALVVDRWNSWVQLYFPEQGVTEWVDLRDLSYETLPPPGHPPTGSD